LIAIVAVLGFKLWKLPNRQLEAVSEVNAKNAILQNKWAGAWQYVCETKQGVVQGEMLLKLIEKADVVGEYSDTIAAGNIEGKIGDLSDSLTGTWKYARGQVGQFRFKLSPGGKSFEGNYSMSPTSSPPENANKWNGSRK
jgi:hypothetical protein